MNNNTTQRDLNCSIFIRYDQMVNVQLTDGKMGDRGPRSLMTQTGLAKHELIQLQLDSQKTEAEKTLHNV